VREYETTFIVQPEISDEGSQAILAKLDGVLESGGATRLMCEDHGKRKLAYEIRKFQKGHYYTLQYLDGGTVVPAVERALRIEESVLRFLTILAEEEVEDVDARKSAAAQAELEQQKRAEERAAREAEEAAARREAEEKEREASQKAAAEAAEAEGEGGEAEKSDARDASSEASDDASGSDDGGKTDASTGEEE
jgi:small subunit ribosomal protein S6